MSKHTPGPWSTSSVGIGDDLSWPIRRVRHDQRGNRIISWIADAHGTQGMDEAERAANARLIAAAPDLLEALEELYWLATDSERMGVHMHEYDRAQAAIAKAKGEDQ